ncbi:MAG: DUF4388 domain-containing protein [Myxococcota bacterium]
MFDPSQIADETTYEGHLSQVPMSELLAAIIRGKVTGRVCVHDEAGANFLYFMQGRPVGVVLSQVIHPLGQLLLELGKVDSGQFVKAQRIIGNGERLVGQVFIEIGAINETDLNETLHIQARRKAQKFVAFQNVPFEFNKGLSFLTGFKSSPMDGPPLIYHALSASMDAGARSAYLQQLSSMRLRAKSMQLGAALESFGFGRAEERFLQRMADWHSVTELDQFGTLPRDDMAALIRYLELIGTLEVAEPAAAAPKPAPAPAPAPQRASTPAPAARPAAPPSPSQRGHIQPRKPDTYGPSPNSASQATRNARDIDQKREEHRKLPSVVIDYASLGLPPDKS